MTIGVAKIRVNRGKWKPSVMLARWLAQCFEGNDGDGWRDYHYLGKALEREVERLGYRKTP